jgi:metal-responsive CopG/Arc/MetJ family transcriptional regulator
MGKKRITISLESELVSYLDSGPNRSALVAEAVREHRARKLEQTLEAAYREDREQTAALASEWEAADAEVDG